MSMESLFHPTNFSFPLCDTLSGVLLIFRLFMASVMLVFYKTYANIVLESQNGSMVCAQNNIYDVLLTILYTMKIWFVPGLPHSVNKLAIKKITVLLLCFCTTFKKQELINNKLISHVRHIGL